MSKAAPAAARRRSGAGSGMWMSACRIAAAVVPIGTLLLVCPASALAGNSDDPNIPECCRPKVARAPQVGVVLLARENCHASSAVAAMVQQAREELTSAPVLFVTLDFSTSDQGEQSEYLAKGLGLDKMWAGFARQYGFALVIDWADRKTVAKITEFDTTATLTRQVAAILSAAE